MRAYDPIQSATAYGPKLTASKPMRLATCTRRLQIVNVASTKPARLSCINLHTLIVVSPGANGNTQVPLGCPKGCRRQPIPLFLVIKVLPRPINRFYGTSSRPNGWLSTHCRRSQRCLGWRWCSVSGPLVSQLAAHRLSYATNLGRFPQINLAPSAMDLGFASTTDQCTCAHFWP